MAKQLFVVLMMVAAVAACQKEQYSSSTGFVSPDYFPAPVYHFENNTITGAGFELGRKLFYDPLLSANNSISCAGCHIQTAAFSHRDHSVSHGIFDRLGTRNAPALMNLAWRSSFMWDGGIPDLDLQPIVPITNHAEMDDTVERVLDKLRHSDRYPVLFKKAFGDTAISSIRFLKALSQFMLRCVSDQSKYDSFRKGQTVFSAAERTGYDLFRQKCAGCHREPLFTDDAFRNNGLPPGPSGDRGRALVTLADTDAYKFRVPSLRNLSFTAPYMHDGRFRTIEAVLQHYDSGVSADTHPDAALRQEARPGIALSASEKARLMDFLKTLDDRSFLENKMLSGE